MKELLTQSRKKREKSKKVTLQPVFIDTQLWDGITKDCIFQCPSSAPVWPFQEDPKGVYGLLESRHVSSHGSGSPSPLPAQAGLHRSTSAGRGIGQPPSSGDWLGWSLQGCLGFTGREADALQPFTTNLRGNSPPCIREKYRVVFQNIYETLTV